jgi:protein SCO1/2
MRRILTPVLAALFVTAAFAPLAGCDRKPEASAASKIAIGGPFQLIDQDGKPVTDKDLLGRPTAMFFGFTYCPEVCPTTLAAMTQWLEQLGPKADRLNVVFVSVDPERDKPAVLKEYLSNFDHRIRGFTGPEAEIAKTAKAYRVYYQKVPIAGGGYTMDHSSAILLFDAKGRFVEPIGYGGPPERGLAALRRLVG